MTTKRQQAMIAAKSAPKVKKTAEMSFEAFYDKNEAALEQLYELNLDALKACGDVTEKKRSFDDFVDWAYSLYTKCEIVDDDDEDEVDDDEDEDEDEEGDADDELTETESDEDDIEVTLGSDDPSSFDGESVDSEDEEDESDDEDESAQENKE